MKDNRHYLYVVLFALVFVLGVYFAGISKIDVILSYFGFESSDGITNSDRGTFGDSTGFINTLFSSLAFAGVILTLYWQIKENGKNKEEDHRKQFEDVFFHMTENFETIIAGLKIEVFDPFANLGLGGTWQLMGSGQKEKEFREGREVFRYLYEQQQIDGKYMTDAICVSKMDGYEHFMEGHLDHYFRYFYRILRYIDDSKMIDDKQKYRYASLLRAHMSSYELLIMHYNGLSSVGCDKLKPLLEKYAMLNNIRYERLSQGSIVEERSFFGEDNYYRDDAFGHESIPSQNVMKQLWLKLIWALISTVVIVPFILPFWNDVVVDVFVSKIPGDSFPFFFILVALFLYHICLKWPKDAKLLCEIRALDNPSEEKKEQIAKAISERCWVLVPLSVIILATVIIVTGSDYYMSGPLSPCYFLVCVFAIAYEILALIFIRVEVRDLYCIRNVKLFS